MDTTCENEQQNRQFTGIRLIIEWAKEAQLNTDEFLQAQTGDEYTVFQLAAWNNRLETVHAVFVWAEVSKPNSNLLKKNLLLTTESCGYNACDRAVDAFWIWAKELKLDTE